MADDGRKTQELLRSLHQPMVEMLALLNETLERERIVHDPSATRNLYRAANWMRLCRMVELFFARLAFLSTAGPDQEDELTQFIAEHLSFETEEGWVGVIDANGALAEHPALSPEAEVNLEQRAERLSRSLKKAVTSCIDAHRISSPIEQLFLMEWKAQQIEYRCNLVLLPQHQVEIAGKTYRVDFLVKGESVSILIELDGHDFHERTRAQAARDRQRERVIQLATGYRLLRFTGREVHQDVKKCIREVLEHAKVNLNLQ